MTLNNPPQALNQISCPACQSIRVSEVLEISDHEYQLAFKATYARCGDCQSFYQSPMPEGEQLASFYPAHYHSFTVNNFISKAKCRQRLRRLRKLVPQSNMVMLDYGCGSGEFLYEASKQVPNARFYGYEISSSKEIIRSPDDRIVIVKGSLSDLLTELPPCDLITMNHVIEHLPNPGSALKDLLSKLKPQGVLEGQTPAADSFEFLVFRRFWSGFHSPRHTVIFSRQGLAAILKSMGLVRIEISGAFNPAGIAVSLASWPHGDKAGSIPRKGLYWFMMLCLAVLLYPIDLLSRNPGIINFSAQKT